MAVLRDYIFDHKVNRGDTIVLSIQDYERILDEIRHSPEGVPVPINILGVLLTKDPSGDVENGKIWIADVAQDPYQIGYKIAEEMMSFLTKGTVDDKVILISPYLVDASNAVKPQ